MAVTKAVSTWSCCDVVLRRALFLLGAIFDFALFVAFFLVTAFFPLSIDK